MELHYLKESEEKRKKRLVICGEMADIIKGELRGEDKNRRAGETLNGFAFLVYLVVTETRRARVPFLALACAHAIIFTEWARDLNSRERKCTSLNVYTEATNNRLEGPIHVRGARRD